MDDCSAGDARLVEAALGGDKDAFAALVTRHWAMAVALAARVLGTPDLARDAAQEAAVAALVSLDRLRASARFGAWFCGITLNVALGLGTPATDGTASRGPRPGTGPGVGRARP